MQIDWLTVAAQLVNFLVLVWLLQRFLYRPISVAMRRREARIEERLAEARAAHARAEEEAETLRRRQRELEDAKGGILDASRAEANDLRKRLDAELREEMDARRATWHRHLQEEREQFAALLQRRAGHQLLDITGRVLAEFADSDLSERIAGRFVARIEALDADTRDRLAKAAARAGSATVETGRPVGTATRGRITRALHAALGTDIPVAYREDEEVLLGARLTIGEQTVEWSAARYLRRLGAMLDEVLDSAGHGSPGGGERARSRA